MIRHVDPEGTAGFSFSKVLRSSFSGLRAELCGACGLASESLGWALLISGSALQGFKVWGPGRV